MAPVASLFNGRLNKEQRYMHEDEFVIRLRIDATSRRSIQYICVLTRDVPVRDESQIDRTLYAWEGCSAG